MSKKTQVTSIPDCDICKLLNLPAHPAYADCYVPAYKTWGNVCKPHFKVNNCELGTGKGQELELIEPDPEPQSQTERIKEAIKGANLNDMSFDELEELFEDRDPAEFL